MRAASPGSAAPAEPASQPLEVGVRDGAGTRPADVAALAARACSESLPGDAGDPARAAQEALNLGEPHQAITDERRAIATASVRVSAPSFFIAFRMCVRTVSGEM